MGILELLNDGDSIEFLSSEKVDFSVIDDKRYGKFFIMVEAREINITEGQVSLLKKADEIFIKKYDNVYNVEVHIKNSEYNKTSAFEYCTYTIFESKNIANLIKAVRYFNSICKIKVQGLHF